MTTEEKAKAYDEVIERVKPLYEWAKKDDSPMWSTYEYLFPQLAESEDERIRKALVWHLKAGEDFVSNGITKAECITYLEKQKEQKPNYCHYGGDPSVERCKYCSAACSARLTEEQKYAEWGEEDELMRTLVIQTLERFGGCGTTGMQIDWLKSLRPQSKEELAKMLQEEYNKGEEIGEREGYTKGYNKGYKDAEKQYNESVAYHYPTILQRPLCWEPGGTCTNPQMDCVNCPRKTTGGFNTTYGTSTATLHGNTSATD